jgi:predicted metal-dependent hydrolase
VEEFNRGSYWKAHETLESVWLQTEYALRLWYYALIKLAVGFYHLERRNSRGARSQLRAALNFLEPFQPIFVGVRLEGAVQEARQRLEALQRGAAWETLEALPRPQLTYDPSPDKR